MNRENFIKSLTIIGLIGPVPFAINGAKDERLGHHNQDDYSETVKLLSRLNLNKPGLKVVEAAKNDPGQAAHKLLDYYRSRDTVKFFIGRKPNRPVPNVASKHDMKVANNALNHIFVGQPEYPPVFVGDDIKWDTDPYPDKEWVWQLNRMYFWNAMARVYWTTNDEKYARAWCNQLLDWIKKNPHNGHHRYAWRSIEAGIRGSSWTKLFQRFIDSPYFMPNVLVMFLNSFYEHATYLMTQYSKGSNWALIEAQGLGFIGIFFPEFKDSEEWRNEAIRRFKKEIHRQVYDDGFQKELSMNYHVGAIGWFLHTFELAKMNGLQAEFSASYLNRIEKMCGAVMKLILPDGTMAQFGDSWKGSPDKYADKFKKWAKLFNRSDFLYLATNGKEGKKPDSTTYALKESGYYSMRSGWDKKAICLVLKCGPDGGFHCQPDNGSFVLYVGGRHLMSDTGSYTYSKEKGRAWWRQTKVHQTLTLDGKNSAYAPNLLLWRPGKDLDTLVVENQSYPKLKHRRAVIFVEKKFFVIVDEAIGKALGHVDLHFQLAPGKAVLVEKDRYVRSDFTDGWNVFVQTIDQPGLQLEKEKGQVSFVYTQKQPRPAFRYRINKKDSDGIRFVTVVVPYQNSAPEISVQIIGKPKIGASHIDLKVTAKVWGIQKLVGYDL